MKIKRSVAGRIIAHAKEKAPIEACGYLAGKNGVALKNYEMTNTDASGEHFSMDPGEQFEVLKKSRNEGLDLLAVYHSHPATPARLSEEDIKLAYDRDLIYVIVSLALKQEEVKAFRILEDGISEEALEVIDDENL